MSERVEVAVSLVTGDLYRFRGLRGPLNPETGKQTWAFKPGNYRLLGVGMEYRTDQEKVFYVGVGGWDDGHYHVCTLGDWVRDFKRIEAPTVELPQTAPEELPRLVAGYKSESKY